VSWKLSSANRWKSGLDFGRLSQTVTARADTDSMALDGSVCGRSTIGNDVLALRLSAKPCHAETLRIVPPVGGLGGQVSR
jgi:hypothetical protein